MRVNLDLDQGIATVQDDVITDHSLRSFVALLERR